MEKKRDKKKEHSGSPRDSNKSSELEGEQRYPIPKPAHPPTIGMEVSKRAEETTITVEPQRH